MENTDRNCPLNVQRAIVEVLDYLWEEERKFAFGCLGEDGKVDSIFVQLVTIDNWLNGTNRIPEGYSSWTGYSEDTDSGDGN